MKKRLRDAIAASADQRLCAKNGTAQAKRLAPRFPLVHRTVRPGGAALAALLKKGCLSSEPPRTPHEKAGGVPRAAYFFLRLCGLPGGLGGLPSRGYSAWNHTGELLPL